MSKKKRDVTRDLPTVAVRVPDDVMRVFEVARAAYGVRSMQELLPVLEDFAESLRAKTQIQAMLRNSAELQAERAGTLRTLKDPSATSSA